MKSPNKSAALIIISNFFFATFSFAQSTMPASNKAILGLKGNGIDTFLLYTPCQSKLISVLEDTCHFVNPQYLFWWKNRKTTIQKFVECLDENGERFTNLASVPIVSNSSKVFQLLEDEFHEIETYKIEPAIMKTKIRGQEVYRQLYVSHVCPISIVFYISERIIQRDFNDEDLQDGKLRDQTGSVLKTNQMGNVNYTYNQATVINALNSLLEKEIKEFEKEKQYKY